MNEQQLRLFGVQESVVRERLTDLLLREDLSLTLFNEQGDIRLHLAASPETLAWAVGEIDERLGAYVYSTDGSSLEQQAVTLLKEKGKTVAVAESCTGGLLASRLTAVPGCSSVFGTGVVSYSWECKKKLLGVQARTLEDYGAVSEQTAREMADGIRRQSGAAVGIGITGEAGPQAAETQPVGTVFVALADAKRTWVKHLQLDAAMSREDIRLAAVAQALDLLRRYMLAYPMVMAGGERHGQVRRQSPPPPAQTKRQRLLTAILPWHGKGKARLIKFVAWAMALLVLMGGILMVYNRVLSPYTNRELQDNLANLYWSETSDLTVEGTQNDAYPLGMRAQFRGLYDINRDIAGWVRIPETELNYPVTVYRDGYYDNHSFNDQFSVYGQPYFDKTATVDALSSRSVTVIRGNNTRDGQMFSSLLSYRRIAYLREHPIVEMNTLYDTARWEIFAVLVVDDHARASEFEYYREHFADNAAFDDYIAKLKQRSLFECSATPNAEEDILLLVTNAEREYHVSGAHLVVAARRLETNADPSTTYAINDRALMPSAIAKATTTTATTIATTSSSTTTTSITTSSTTDTTQPSSSTDASDTTASATDTTTQDGTTATQDTDSTTDPSVSSIDDSTTATTDVGGGEDTEIQSHDYLGN
ncbi:MAG: nicotinamide-nucleotide amidohydrolase family protein [Clostridia bacterium]|nr:nicotinamide-nucleotide amidohydrolase family protein [Clostridia bacterium]